MSKLIDLRTKTRAELLVERGVSRLDAPTLEAGKVRGTPAMRDALAWRASDDLVLILGGGVGTGKTFAASALVALEPPGTWPAPRVVKAWDVAAIAPWDSDGVRAYAAHSLLVIDDLGSGGEMARQVATVERVLDERLCAGRRTAVTTNLTAGTLQQFGARFVSRVNGYGRVRFYSGADMRQGAA